MMLPRDRAGLTLIEVLVSMIIFTVGALGFAAGSAAVVIAMAADARRSASASLATSTVEKAHSSSCSAISGGTVSRSGVTGTWSASGERVLTIDQRITRATTRSIHEDRYLSAVPCE